MRIVTGVAVNAAALMRRIRARLERHGATGPVRAVARPVRPGHAPVPALAPARTRRPRQLR